jgi:hypothetical protein
MGAIRLIYDETARQMKELGWWGELNVEGTRKIMAGNLRYCLQDNRLFLPKEQSIIEKKHRLCWGRIRVEELDDLPWLAEFDKEVPEDPLAYHHPFTSIGFGVMYSRRHREDPDGRKPVREFVADSLIGAIADNPEALLTVSKTDFEALVAELFARRGFEVDLLRPSKDDGIDFLAVRNEDTPEPLVLAVQTKHPNAKEDGEKRSALPVSTVREIYGVAKAWNLHGAVAVTSSTYSTEAKRFAEMKPAEIEVVDAAVIIEWTRRYRWNKDE